MARCKHQPDPGLRKRHRPLPSLPPPQQNNDDDRTRPSQKGPTRPLRILISEMAYLIWVLRCERVVQEKCHNERQITQRWLDAINKRLTMDKIIATRVKQGKEYVRKVRAT